MRKFEYKHPEGPQIVVEADTEEAARDLLVEWWIANLRKGLFDSVHGTFVDGFVKELRS